jgi:hypothetical protein
MLRFDDVISKANKEFSKLCKENGKFDEEIHSLQLKAVVKAIVDVINDESSMIQAMIERDRKIGRK